MKTVLFDFDGTLADSIDTILQIVNNVLRAYGYPEIDSMKFGEMRNQSLYQVLKNLKISPFLLPFMFLHGKMLFANRRKNILPVKGIKEVLTELIKKGYKIGIATSNTRNSIDQFLQAYDFPIIDYKYTSLNIFGKDKIIQKCIDQHSIDKNSVIYVGDELRDIVASQKAGIPVISVTWGFNSEESLSEANPKRIVSKPSELIKKIEEIL